MADTATQPETATERVAADEDIDLSVQLGGLALLVGVLGLVVSFALDTQFTVDAAEGPETVVAVMTHDLWVPIQVVDTVSLLFVAAGLLVLLRYLARRGEPLLAAAALGTLAIGVVLDLVEFVFAAYAGPRLFSEPLGTGLSQAQIETILMGYQAVGIGLLTVTRAFLGLALVLTGIALYRSSTYNPVFAYGGVVVGLILGSFMLVPLGSVPIGVVVIVLAGLWLLGLGGSMLRVNPGRPEATSVP